MINKLIIKLLRNMRPKLGRYLKWLVPSKEKILLIYSRRWLNKLLKRIIRLKAMMIRKNLKKVKPKRKKVHVVDYFMYIYLKYVSIKFVTFKSYTTFK